jgi:hypothetical protein
MPRDLLQGPLLAGRILLTLRGGKQRRINSARPIDRSRHRDHSVRKECSEKYLQCNDPRIRIHLLDDGAFGQFPEAFLRVLWAYLSALWVQLHVLC